VPGAGFRVARGLDHHVERQRQQVGHGLAQRDIARRDRRLGCGGAVAAPGADAHVLQRRGNARQVFVGGGQNLQPLHAAALRDQRQPELTRPDQGRGDGLLARGAEQQLKLHGHPPNEIVLRPWWRLHSAGTGPSDPWCRNSTVVLTAVRIRRQRGP
jgi:hypothetical protein